MKQLFLSAALVALLMGSESCKSRNKENERDLNQSTTTPTSNPGANAPASQTPVVVNSDQAMITGVTDATKDIKGLQTRVENGVIYLSGTISREDNMRITPTLTSLRPKSINRDNLTVQQ